MTNLYDAPAGSPAGAPYPSEPGFPDPARDPARRNPARRKRRLRWSAGIVLAGFLAGGGITLALVSGSPASSAQASELNTALSAAASTTASVPAARVRRALARLRRIGGVDGTVSFHGKNGFRTLSFERGTIGSVNGNDVVIKAPNGTTWTWLIVSNTVVRKKGARTTTGALSEGETVFAAGPVVNGARDARLILIRAPGSPDSPQPAGSESAQTSLS